MGGCVTTQPSSRRDAASALVAVPERSYDEEGPRLEETHLRTHAQDMIEMMVRRIVDRFDPERVILFGSHATATADAHSDVDLLVVMPVAGSRRKKAIEIGVALHDIRVPKDIIVTTPEDFAWRQEVVGTIERPAARTGKVLYARE